MQFNTALSLAAGTALLASSTVGLELNTLNFDITEHTLSEITDVTDTTGYNSLAFGQIESLAENEAGNCPLPEDCHLGITLQHIP